MAGILSGSGFRFETQSVGGTWRWVVFANNTYGTGQLYQVSDITTPFGILQQALIPIPDDVIACMNQSILDIKQQFAPLMSLVSPSSLIFSSSVTEGDSAISVGEVIVQNAGAFGSFMDVTATTGAPWLNVDPSFVKSLNKGEQASFDIIANPLNLLNVNSPYSGTVILQDNRVPSTMLTATVVLVVKPRPVIGVSPANINLSYFLTSNTAGGAQQLVVENSGPVDSILNATLSKVNGQTWWTFVPTVVGPLGVGGTSIVTISVVTANAPQQQGTYADTLRITSPNAANSPVDVPVILVVT
jgi:hypothetical protein